MLAINDYQLLSRRVDSAKVCGSLFPKSKENIAAIVADAKVQTEKCLESIYGVKEGERTFANTARAADLGASNLGVAAAALSVTKNTNPDKALRDAAAEAVVELEKLSIDSFASNKRLYEAFRALGLADVAASGTEQQKYWFQERMEAFKRKGLELPDAEFQQAVDLQKQLAELSTKFDVNIAEDNRKVVLPVAETSGVPAGVLEACKKVTNDKGEECYELGMDYPTYFGVMKNCTVASTRKTMSEAFESRAYPANLEVLHQVIETRHKLAVLLGYQSYAHVDLSDKMAKTPETAIDFVNSLLPRLATKWVAEKKKLEDAGLHESVKQTTEEPAGSFYNYDVAFLMNQFKEKHLSVDEQAIREYFPMESTVKALYTIYERFFDITFETVSADFWHADVSLMSVTDNQSKKLLGYVVMDLFPREGKYSHACCEGVVPPLKRDDSGSDGSFSPAVAVVLANFPKPTADKPALFMHDDVVTFFHEFGHAIHYLFGHAELATVAGYNVKMDFVELPSQMLEEWMWDKDILKMASKHYKTGEPLPDALIEKKIESKRAFSGRDGLRQMVFATQSLAYFGAAVGSIPASAQDTTKVVHEIEQRVLVGIRTNPNGHFQCSFGHLLG
jgi:thimet oligopeptidase